MYQAGSPATRGWDIAPTWRKSRDRDEPKDGFDLGVVTNRILDPAHVAVRHAVRIKPGPGLPSRRIIDVTERNTARF